MAKGSRLSAPVAPAAAAVVSLVITEPKNVPCCQDRASVTSGTTEARRPPNKIAEIGTPLGFSHSGDTTGHWRMGVVKRALGWAALRPLTGVHGRRSQSTRCAGGGSVMSSHHTSPSSVMAQFVKIELRSNVRMALGFDFSLVPGATPNTPASGLMA